MDRELVPHIVITQIPGIPGIDGEKLNYGSWHLLNEALTCFVNQEYFACIICLTTSIELWLREELKKEGNLKKLLKSARATNLVSDEEFAALDALRDQ